MESSSTFPPSTPTTPPLTRRQRIEQIFRERHRNQCNAKRHYTTWGEAEAHALEIFDQHGPVLFAYHHRRAEGGCGDWHLANDDRGSERRRNKFWWQRSQYERSTKTPKDLRLPRRRRFEPRVS